MRSAFEAWAQRDGHIVRRREDKPDEYLVYETQRRWMIWQAALTHGAQAAAEAPSRFTPTGARSEQRATPAQPVDAAARERVLDEVLAAIDGLDERTSLAGVRELIQGMKARQKALAE